VADAENIEATEEDFEEEVVRVAEAYRMEADKVRKMMNEDGKEEIMKDLAVKKAVDFVVANALETK
jgi:trigger factor